MSAIQRALISVSDKTGIVEFAQALAEQDIEILSTSGGLLRLVSPWLKIISRLLKFQTTPVSRK